ncbi:MAG: M14 family zinc carboxypeptidase [Candidatus Saccharimonadales bacterium]|jgi:protein MpaA
MSPQIEAASQPKRDLKGKIIKATRLTLRTLSEFILWIKLIISRSLDTFWRKRKLVSRLFSYFIIFIVIGFGIYTFLPQSIYFSFTNQRNCIINPAIFPNIFKSSPDKTFSINRTANVSIGKMPIFTYRLCATLRSAPLSQSAYTNDQQLSIGNLRLNKSIRIDTSKYSVVVNNPVDNKAIPLNQPLKYKLSQADTNFDYVLTANNQQSLCLLNNKVYLTCSLSPLKFAYAANYQTSLVRKFHNQTIGIVLIKSVQTITATTITQSSINPGAMVYDKPQQIILQTDKTLTSMQSVSLTTKGGNGSIVNIPITSSYSGNNITINITNPLPRQTLFDLHINNLTASDQSTLEQPYDLIFTTSGGPQVSNVNLPSYGVSFDQSIVITFNQPLLASQSVNSIASLTVNGVSQAATYSINGDQLIIHPTENYPVCATINVQLNNQIQNDYGIAGNSAWSYSTRSHCYTTFSIGTSVKGRPITAYKFGDGSSMVLYIGAMEGNEQNSSELLSQWISSVDANPGRIPAYRTIVIIPTINPDGFAADNRLNADGIDLNRNFPANNWQTEVTEPTAPTVWTNDGGPYPLSEPESQALANYYATNLPRLTLTMHSHGGIVEANDASDSIALGAQYASLAGYEAIPTYAIGNFFDYTTTGAFEDWANDKLNLPVLEVELESATSDEYSRNLSALWAMAQVSP